MILQLPSISIHQSKCILLSSLISRDRVFKTSSSVPFQSVTTWGTSFSSLPSPAPSPPRKRRRQEHLGFQIGAEWGCKALVKKIRPLASSNFFYKKHFLSHSYLTCNIFILPFLTLPYCHHTLNLILRTIQRAFFVEFPQGIPAGTQHTPTHRSTSSLACAEGMQTDPNISLSLKQLTCQI